MGRHGLVCGLLLLASGALAQATYQNPVGAGGHAKDPAVLVDAGTYHLFTSWTGDATLAGNVPLQRATDVVGWAYLGDALPTLPAWVDASAPEVRGPAALARPALGYYLLYFSARHADDGSPRAGRRCIGFAAATVPTMLLGGGTSVVPNDDPIVCLDDGDVLDPSVFTAPAPSGDPYAWLVWVERHDGVPDVVQHVLLDPNGIEPLAGLPPFPLLTAETHSNSWEQGLLANPAVVQDPGTGGWRLFYSANDPLYAPATPSIEVYIGQNLHPARYGTNWATCQPGPYGFFLPCQRSDRGPWLRSQNGAFRPGDAEFFTDAGGAAWMVYDASERTPIYLGNRYEAPTLRLDRACFAPDGTPRTDAPTTDVRSLVRDSDCGTDVQLLAEPWPEADQLFHQDPRWRGSDGAWTVDLGDERTLWLFGDTFIDPEGVSREQSFFINNSIAIQEGADPTLADMTFHWKTNAAGNPRSYFTSTPAGSLYWGGAGAVIGSKLVLFQRGFVSGARTPTKAVIIPNYEDDPSTWVQEWYDVPADPDGYIYDPHYAIKEGQYLYVYVVRPAAATGTTFATGALVRFGLEKAKNGNFTAGKWWTGTSFQADATPAVLWGDSTQPSVHRLPGGNYLAVMGGTYFGPGRLSIAPARTGPFPAFANFFTPPESSWGGDAGGVLTYIWHAVPQLTGAPVPVVYSTHGHDIWSDTSPYYPRFVRLTPP